MGYDIRAGLAAAHLSGREVSQYDHTFLSGALTPWLQFETKRET
jgi:hypothetical protein